MVREPSRHAVCTLLSQECPKNPRRSILHGQDEVISSLREVTKSRGPLGDNTSDEPPPPFWALFGPTLSGGLKVA